MYREGLTARQIGERVSVPFRTILRHLHKAGVTLRNPGDPINAALRDRALLERLYVAERKSTTQIAAEIGSSASHVSKWLRRHGIEMRSTGSEKGHQRTTEKSRELQSKARRGKHLASDNPNWRGGIPFHDPDRNRFQAKVWVKAVKTRDGWKCVECASTERLHAHHIKRWRDYPDLRYDVSNGITLCYSCHERAHGRGFKFRFGSRMSKSHERAAPQG